MPSHFRRLRQAHHGQQAGREIAQRAIIAQLGLAPDIQERHRIQRVRGVRLVRDAINHLLGVAVIGGDDDFAADGLHRLDHAPDANIQCFDG